MIVFGLFNRRRGDHDINQNFHSINEWPDHVVTLEGNTFNKFIEKYPLSMVDFWAPWCTPCKAMAPRLRRLSKMYKGKIAFGKLDTQKNQDIARQYKIMGIPHLVFFRYGEKITSITGLKSVGELRNLIDDLLKNKER
jgi:thioredoxin 1